MRSRIIGWIRAHIPAVLLGIVVIGVGVFSLTYHYPVAESDTASLRYDKAYWEDMIRSKGGAKAYAVLLERYTGGSKAHIAAHAMGDALYSVLGDEGLTFCTSAFGYGCYHGVYAAAVAQNGLAAVPHLWERCESKGDVPVTNCEHGFGHAFMDYFGPAKLSEALALCTDLSEPERDYECIKGVFMEYNIQPIAQYTGVATGFREFDPKNPYAPCSSLEDRYTNLCHYSLGQWYKLLGKDAATCDGLSGTLREICVLGTQN